MWQDTGNLVSVSSFIDTSQLPGGTFYDTFAAAEAKYGSHTVTGIQLVTDAGWKFGTQTMLVDNVRINGRTFTFEGHSDGDQGVDNGQGGDEAEGD